MLAAPWSAFGGGVCRAAGFHRQSAAAGPRESDQGFGAPLLGICGVEKGCSNQESQHTGLAGSDTTQETANLEIEYRQEFEGAFWGGYSRVTPELMGRVAGRGVQRSVLRRNFFGLSLQ